MEESIKNELGKANAIFKKEKEKLITLEDKRSNTIEEMNAISIKTSVKVLKDYSGYLDSVNSKIKEQKNVVNNAKKNVDIIKRKLIEASKERKIFEKLKDKKFQEYLKMEKKKEEKLVDEIISFKQSKRKV
jgi:flagellar FliJ protein